MMQRGQMYLRSGVIAASLAVAAVLGAGGAARADVPAPQPVPAAATDFIAAAMAGLHNLVPGIQNTGSVANYLCQFTADDAAKVHECQTNPQYLSSAPVHR